LNKLKALIERVYDTYEQTWRQFAMTKQLQEEKARERNARANEKRKEKRRQEQAQ
jgi:hypothetical protein